MLEKSNFKIVYEDIFNSSIYDYLYSSGEFLSFIAKFHKGM